MFQTARMHKIKVVTLNKYSTHVVNSLHEKGVVQINDISEQIQQDSQLAELLNPSKVTPLTGKISSLLMKCSGLSELLGDAISGHVGIKDMLKSFISPEIPKKTEIEPISGEELVNKAESLLNEVESQTKVIEDQLNSLDGRKSELKSNKLLANKLKGFDIDLSLLNETKYTFTIVGRINAESVDNFKKESAKITDSFLILDAPDENKLKKIVVLLALSEFKDEFYSIVRTFDFEKFETDNLDGKPNDIIGSADLELGSLEKEKSQLYSKLKEIAKKHDDDVVVLKEQLEIERERNEVFSAFGETDKTVMLEAWVPFKDLEKVKNLVDSSTEGYSVVVVEDVDEDDSKVPVLHDNPKIVKPYEFLVDMYSPVRYRAIDPSFLVFIMFPFFFGYCLTDSFYGLMLVVLGIILIKGMGKVNETMGKLGSIIIACGLWTIVLGLITNGLLGDFFSRFLNMTLPTVIPMFDAFKNPQNILMVAILIGFIYTNIGFVLGIINNFRYGEKKEALGSQIVWFVFEAGLIFLAVGMFVPVVGVIGQAIGAIFLIATFAILIYCNGLYGMMDVFSWLGNILSYARLLALCLATGGIAMTVNIIAGMVDAMLPVPYLSLILAVFIFIAGHIVNFLFQVLGAFINSLRLHYVEFFAQFFFEGKNNFNPFSAGRILTRLKK
ncbi:MAG: V-type ATP synthase subunit I [Methanobrevibacter sp.]|jgi:V/A-type H+-transporting ATPase subunit I|nr:V-type ATP synthase subunit I [Candidatus Methanovirga basalitermitum]